MSAVMMSAVMMSAFAMEDFRLGKSPGLGKVRGVAAIAVLCARRLFLVVKSRCSNGEAGRR